MRVRGKARAVLAGAAALVLLAAPAKVSAVTAADAPVPYRMAPDAQGVTGSENTADAPQLQSGGRTYRDTLEPGRRKYYTVHLDAGSSAYVSAVAIPRPGGSMGSRDGIEVALAAPDGKQCGPGRHRTFLSAGGAYPVADYAERAAGAGGACAAAGTYRFSVERGDAAGGDPAAVPVELKYMTGPADAAPADTRAVAGSRTATPGGSGFNDAVEIRPGTVDDELRPGETHFYRVPVEAGQRLAASARFGDAPDVAGPPYVITGVRMGLNNAARGYVMNRTGGYQGTPAALSLTTPPVADGTDTTGGDAARGMRLAGWYYLQVSLNPKVGQGRPAKGPVKVPVTLTVDVGKDVKPPPRSAPSGLSAATAAHTHDDRLRLVGYVGTTTGSLLLLALAAWTWAARRTAR
ncbi:hypothetical protein [Streptomyces sp. NPDC002537]